MSQNFSAGDFLVFQIESGFAILRVLGVDDLEGSRIWHLAAYNDLFLTVDDAEKAASIPQKLSPSKSHLALTNRAFESTQVAKITSVPLTSLEAAPLEEWRNNDEREVYDRSVRLLLGLR